MRRVNRRRKRLKHGVVVILDAKLERNQEEIRRPGKLVAVAEWRGGHGKRDTKVGV